uniref:DNA-directed RNA polymerase III subunit RPC6 n=1 Tax=Meloidogyne hapla TaxID=6305 RepID=A0A1I8AZA7_MELHA
MAGTSLEANVTDPGGLESLDARVLQMLAQRPDGFSNAELLKEECSNRIEMSAMQPVDEIPTTAVELGAVVNRLLSESKIEMLRRADQAGGGSDFYLRLKKGSDLTNASPEEQLVYSIVEEAKRMGVWIRDIRERSGLNDLQMRRVLKALEQRKLIRSIKAAGTTRKTYILCGLEADESLTGGTFYSDQQLDSEFVQTLIHVCTNWLLQRARQAEELHRLDPVAQREASFVLSEEVVALRPRKRTTPLASIPCLQCPMSRECTPGHVISPENCEYFKRYFEL